MALPVRPLPTSSVTLKDGTKVAFRSLTRAEAIALRAFAVGSREDEAERQMIAGAMDASPDEVAAWYAATPSPDVGQLVEAIAIFSGLATEESIEKAKLAGETPAVTGYGTDPKSPTSEP